MHVVNTRVRSLYRSQVVIVRRSLDAPLSQVRYWASSDLQASPERLLSHIATRWDIEVLFGDSNEELGLDHSQLMNAIAIVRFWRKNASPYKRSGNAMSPLGRHAVTSSVAIVARFSIGFMSSPNQASNQTPCMSCSPLEAFQPKSARIEYIDFPQFT